MDAIHVAGGLIESIPYVIAPVAIERGYNVPAAEQIKAAVDVPVIVVGKLHDGDYAESLLAEGEDVYKRQVHGLAVRSQNSLAERRP